MTIAANGQPAAAGSALTTVVIDAGHSVFYFGSDNHIHELANNGSVWIFNDLTTAANGPLAESGSVLTSAVVEGKQSIYYLGTDNHVYELVYKDSKWVSNDLTADSVHFLTRQKQAPLPQAGSALTAVSLGGNLDVYYVGNNNHIIELALRGSWVWRDLTIDGDGSLTQPATGSSLTSTVDDEKHMSVYYLGYDNHVYEITYKNGSWVCTDLTNDAKSNN